MTARAEVTARYVGGPRRETDLVVWHATAGESASSSLNWMNRPGVPSAQQSSYHAIVERDGRVFLMAPVHRRAYHAGRSAWPVPPDGEIIGSINGRSIGIAFANRNLPRGDAKYEAVTEGQIDSAIELLLFWKARYPWLGNPAQHIRHRDCAPGRKSDPLPDILDWDAFRERIRRDVGGA
jgi:N-acetylmuramoyl-L-alanine amidase